MSAKELRSKSSKELEKLLDENRRELFNIRMQASVAGQYTKVHNFKRLRREIATMITILGEGATK